MEYIGGSDLPAYFQELGFPFRPNAYFNSGVMVVDVARWQQRRLTERLVNWLNYCPVDLRNGDQDVLNVCLEGEWAELSPRFNCCQNSWWIFSRPASLPSDLRSREPGIREAWRKTAVLHYVGPKPWQRDYYKYAYYTRYTLAWWHEARRLRLAAVHIQSSLEIIDWLLRCVCTRKSWAAWWYWGLRRRVVQCFTSQRTPDSKPVTTGKH